jgi:hypothetical protein
MMKKFFSKNGSESLCALSILFGFSVFLCYWYRYNFSSQYISGWDLPGQIAAVERMMQQLPHLRFVFYDPAWFGGWGLDLFYAPLSHIAAALLAYPLSLVSKEPAALACHVILVIGCSALPFSFWYLLLPMAKNIVGGDRLSLNDSCILAFSVSLLGFWFLNHDYQFWGIGSASVMGIGLFAQLFGWHFLLLHAGALARLLETGETRFESLTSIFFALLVLSHSLTSIFALGFVLLLALWYQNFAWRILRAHCLGLGLAGFWLFPAYALSSTYAVYSMIRPSGDFLEILLRYPLALLLKHVQSSLSGKFSAIDLATILTDLFFFLFIPCQPIRRSTTAIVFFVVDLIAIVFTNSNFVASSLQMTVHYYRFFGDELLILAALLSLVPVGIMQTFKSKTVRRILGTCIYMLLLSGIYSITCFPHHERAKTEELLGKPSQSQLQVLGYFRNMPVKGRILLEHFDDEDKHGFLTAHYLEGRLYKETGFEIINGLFIEGSNAYRLASTSADMLGARTWATNLIFNDSSDKYGVELALSELREFGITHVVCTEGSKLFQTIKSQTLGPVVSFGPYAIMQINQLPAWKIKPQNKTIVGYIDIAHTLPFQMLEAYVLTHELLYKNVEVIDLTDQPVPPGVPIVIMNTGGETGPIRFPRMLDTEGVAELKLRRLNFDPHWTIDHYHVWYQANAEYDLYQSVTKYLDAIKLSGQILEILPKATVIPGLASTDKSPALLWSKDLQSINLVNLSPGKFVKLAYSFLPFWHSPSALILRGSAEQIYVYPTSSQVTLFFDEWHTPYLWLGSFMTATSALYLSGLAKRPIRIVHMSATAFIRSLSRRIYTRLKKIWSKH